MFFVNRSEIEGRLDPYFYLPEFRQQIELFKQLNFKQLGDFIENWDRGDGPRDGFYTDDTSQIYFLRVQNLKENSIDLTDVKFIYRHIHETKLKRSQVTAGDIVFAISGTKENLGTVSIVPNHIKEANLNSALVRLGLNAEINKEFFCLLFSLDFIRQQIDFIGKGAAQNNLNNKEISSIYIPIFSLEKQNEIVQFYNEKRKEYKNKLTQSQTLLNSISDYLLEKLGITVPKVDNSLSSRIFFVNANDIRGGRLDPFNQIGYYREFAEKLLQNKFGYKPLKDFIIHDCSGNWGNDIVDNFDENIFDKYLIVRATEFDNQDNLQLNADKIKFRLLDKQKLSNLRIQENDILVEKSGGSENQPVGRVAILDTHILEKYDGNIAFSNFIHKISVDKNMIDPHFLFYYLKMLHHFKYTERMQSQTNGIRNLILKDFFDIPILNVPLETQKTIVAHIKQIRKQAKNLEQQAKDLLQQTQQEIEKMILGND